MEENDEIIRSGNTREEYRKVRNEYGRIRKGRNFQWHVIGKSKEEAKLFYIYVNEKNET